MVHRRKTTSPLPVLEPVSLAITILVLWVKALGEGYLVPSQLLLMGLLEEGCSEVRSSPLNLHHHRCSAPRPLSRTNNHNNREDCLEVP